MACWLVVTAKVHDRAALAAGYAPAAAKIAAAFGGTYLLRGPVSEQLEGESLVGQSAVVLEFPDRAAAMAFYSSPEYAEAKKLREGIAEMSIALVDAPKAAGA